MKEVWTSNSVKETMDIGGKVASLFENGNVITLCGELGAGKTELIKGICNYFDVEEIVTSPTFTIINQYTGESKNGKQVIIYHLDLYRIKNPDELVEIGYDECISDPDSIKLIEWPEKAGNKLSNPDFEIYISADLDDENKRIVSLKK